MLTQARRNVAETDLRNIELRYGDAEFLPFEDGYGDAVLASCAIFFLLDMLIGLVEWQRVVKPGGSPFLAWVNRNAAEVYKDFYS